MGSLKIANDNDSGSNNEQSGINYIVSFKYYCSCEVDIIPLFIQFNIYLLHSSLRAWHNPGHLIKIKLPPGVYVPVGGHK